MVTSVVTLHPKLDAFGIFINLDICTDVRGVFMSLTYAAQRSEGSTHKSVAITAVVLLHLGFLYAFTHGLNVVNMVKPFKDTVAVFIPDEAPPEEPLPVPKLKDLPPVDNIVPEDVPAPTPLEVPPDIVMSTPAGDAAITTEATSTEVAPARSFSIKRRVDPIYPSASRRAGETGTVLLTVVVGPDGTPTDVEVVRSSGFAGLDQAAIEAVRKWRFTVASDSSYARVQLPVTFRLENSR
jgi:protein TonB